MEKLLFLSPEWIEQAKIAINTSEKYKKGAKHIQDSISMKIVGKHPMSAGAEESYFFVDIKNGVCRETSLGQHKADFYLTAKADDWRAVLDGKLEIVPAILKGKIKLKGNLLHMLKNAIPTALLVECFQAVPTRYE